MSLEFILTLEIRHFAIQLGTSDHSGSVHRDRASLPDAMAGGCADRPSGQINATRMNPLGTHSSYRNCG